MAEGELILPDESVIEVDPTDYTVEVDGLGTVTAHANQGASRLIERFKKPVYTAVVRAVGEEITEAENMLWNVLLSRYLDNAEGVSLDFIGRRVGEPRQSQNDPDYRVRIRARVLINRSRGGPEDLYAICRALGVTAFIRNTGRASLRLDILTRSTNPAIRTQIADLLGEATSAGVRLHVNADATSGLSFTLGSVSSAEIGSFLGSVSDPDVGTETLSHSRMV